MTTTTITELILALDPASAITGYGLLECVRDVEVPDKIRGLALRDAGRLRSDRAQYLDRVAEIVRELRAMVQEIREERGPSAELIVVMEVPSGYVHRRRHKGGGRGLAVYGVAVGAMWGVLQTMNVAVYTVDELHWTTRWSKADRRLVVQGEFPWLDLSVDKGHDISDAIALGLWWCYRRSSRNERRDQRPAAEDRGAVDAEGSADVPVQVPGWNGHDRR